MLGSVVRTLARVKTNFNVITLVELYIGKGTHRTGIDADPTLTAKFVDSSTVSERRIGEYRDKADAGSEFFGEQQTVLANPPKSRQVCC